MILGLNAYHADSSACLVRDGKLIAAAEEERFRRIKHWASVPSEAIRYCLAEAGIAFDAGDLRDRLDFFTCPGLRFPHPAFFRGESPSAGITGHLRRNTEYADRRPKN